MLDQASLGAFVDLHSHDPDGWRERLSLLDELRLDHVELWLEYEPAVRETGALVHAFAGRRSIMHAPFIGMSLATDWAPLAALSVDRCHRAIEVAGAIGCEVVTIHAGMHASHESHDAALGRLIERFQRFARIPIPTVTLENMAARGGATRETLAGCEDLAALLTALPGAGITLDVGHCVQNGEDPADLFSAFSEHVHDIHLHDARRGGRAHMALGEGDLDLESLLQTLESSDYGGFLTIETLGTEALRQSVTCLAHLNVRGRNGSRPPMAA
jgi:sugar phosphate isomerase/epimerase